MRFLSFFFLIFFFSITDVSSQNDQFQEALNAYNIGEYQTSIKILEGLIEVGEISEELHYNLGLSYLKSDELSEAIASLHKVLLLDPNHSQALAALEIAEGKISTPITEIPDFIVYDLFVQFAESMSISAWSVTQIILLIVLFVLLYLILFKSKSLKIFGSLAVLVSLLAFWSFLNAQFLKDRLVNPVLVVVKIENTEIYTGADDRSEVVTIVGEGVTAKSTDKLNDWIKIELADRDIGWVQKEKVIIIQ